MTRLVSNGTKAFKDGKVEDEVDASWVSGCQLLVLLSETLITEDSWFGFPAV